jgi:serine phosphatase RsbU (regulator of sigma subunit)
MIGAFLGVSMHMIFIILFAIYKINLLMWFNILISVPAFTVAFFLSYNGRLKIPPIIGTLEVSVHQILGVLLMGQETGFQLLLFCLIPVGMLFRRWRISFFINSTIALILFISIIWFDSGQFKIYELAPDTLKFIRSVNSLGLFAIVGIILFYYITLSRKLYNKIEEANYNLNQINDELTVTIEKLNIQNDWIESQNKILFEQNKEITASISYASRIQAALLPQKEVLEKTLPNHFILFLPKEIVSGDFYWASQVDHKIIFCAADCTGHGVPGAFMSLLGMAFLDEIVNRRKVLTSTGILDSLRIEIIKALKQTGKKEDQMEGMDIALCIYDKTTRQLDYAGAFNPLYLVRNGNLEEFIGDRIPVSYIENLQQNFNSKTINIEEGDTIYIFSDGYADQFGGTDRLKYRYGPMRDYIRKIHDMPMSEQKILLEKNFIAWKGDNEQTDDVILMGVRF